MGVFDREGVWYCRFYVVARNGKRERIKRSTGIKVPPEDRPREYSRSKQQAEEAERQLQRIAQLEASGLARAPSQKIRLERALSDLIERKERGQRSQATINIVIQKSKHLFAFFGPDRDTATIGDDQVEEYVSWALGSGRDPASIERETRHLVEAVGLYHPRPKRPDLGKVGTPGERFLEPDEFDAMLRAADIHSARSGRVGLVERRDWIAMSVCMGITNGRLCKVRYEDIRLDANLLVIQHAGTTDRGISIHPMCREILARRRHLSPPFPPWTSMPKRIKELCQECGIPHPPPVAAAEALMRAWEDRAAAQDISSKRDHLVMYVHLGLTYSELYRIGSGDIDWDGNQVFVRGTKTESRLRAIPMTDDVRAILESRRGRSPMFKNWSDANMNRDLDIFAKIAGIAPVCPNDLRRTFATWLARAGVPALHLSKLMGHSSTRMLEQVYARVERGKHMHDAIALIPPAKGPEK